MKWNYKLRQCKLVALLLALPLSIDRGAAVPLCSSRTATQPLSVPYSRELHYNTWSAERTATFYYGLNVNFFTAMGDRGGGGVGVGNYNVKGGGGVGGGAVERYTG
jgi:hypothetical protein